MKFGVIVFPGSNCDLDAFYLVRDILRQPVVYIRHDLDDLDDLADCDALILPGGFSYGDYLRSGAIACFSRIMSSAAEFAAGGGLVLGICNGFQVLTEAGLLPGALYRNDNLQFRCQQIYVRVENRRPPLPTRLPWALFSRSQSPTATATITLLRKFYSRWRKSGSSSFATLTNMVG